MKVRRRSLAKRQRSKSRKSKTRRSRFARSANERFAQPTAKFGGSALSRRRSPPRRRAASSPHTPSPYTNRVNNMYIAQGYLRPSPKSPSPWTRQYTAKPYPSTLRVDRRVKGAQKCLGRPGPSHSLS